MGQIDNRYHVTCTCCGLIKTASQKASAKSGMIEHLERHPKSETITTSVYDTMHRGGGQVVYGGRIFNNNVSHGMGVKD